MKVKLLTSLKIDGKLHNQGSEINVSKQQKEKWLAKGWIAIEEKKELKSKKKETKELKIDIKETKDEGNQN